MAKVHTPKPVTDHILVLFDHDGTLCDTNPLAYESIKYAYKATLDSLKLENNNDIDWNRIFTETSGTTEKNFIHYMSYIRNIPRETVSDFENKYYHFRAKWFETMRATGEYVWDSYYPDAHQLAYECVRRKNVTPWLLTGNPEIVLQERITNSLRDIFTGSGKDHKLQGVFGDESLSRSGMISLAIEKASKIFGKDILKKNSHGFYKNIVYVADSRNDFFAGLEASIRTVWVPARKLQTVIEIKNQDYVKFIEKTVGKNIMITNDLSSKDAFDYIFLKR
jgi:phosphoglycolate phosphatase-like HAD superfamily hydrolase